MAIPGTLELPYTLEQRAWMRQQAIDIRASLPRYLAKGLADEAAHWERVAQGLEEADRRGVDPCPSIAPMSEDEARLVAPQWGSYVRSGDPGAIMYSAIPPERAEHRDAMIAHIDGHCMESARINVAAGDFLDGPAELVALRAYLEGLEYPAE